MRSLMCTCLAALTQSTRADCAAASDLLLIYCWSIDACTPSISHSSPQIIIRGANFYCYEIEEIVLRVAGTVPARVAATSVCDDTQATEVQPHSR